MKPNAHRVHYDCTPDFTRHTQTCQTPDCRHTHNLAWLSLLGTLLGLEASRQWGFQKLRASIHSLTHYPLSPLPSSPQTARLEVSFRGDFTFVGECRASPPVGFRGKFDDLESLPWRMCVCPSAWCPGRAWRWIPPKNSQMPASAVL